MTNAATNLQGRWANLRPLLPSDSPILYKMEIGTGWRLGGATPSPREYEDCLWRNILAQFAICSHDSPALLGLVAAYKADMVNGHCSMLLLSSDRSPAGSIRTMEGAILFIGYVFSHWRFRKIYFEADERTAEQYHSLYNRLEIPLESRLKEHAFVDGTYVDSLTFALHRSSWEKFAIDPGCFAPTIAESPTSQSNENNRVA